MSFTISITRPSRETQQFVTRLVVRPTGKAALSRNLGRKKALQLSAKLLAVCGASPDLLSQVANLR